MKPTANTPEVITTNNAAVNPKTAKPKSGDKDSADRFAHHEGDKQVVSGIGDIADEETERHSTTTEHNEASRTRE